VAASIKENELKIIESLPKYFQSAVWIPEESKQIPIVSQIFLQNDDYNWHINDCYIFTYCLSGSKRLYISNRELTLKAGEAVILPQNIRHKFCTSSPETRVLLFCFSYNLSEKIDSKITEESFSPTTDEKKLLFSAVKSFIAGADNLDSSLYFAIALNRFIRKYCPDPVKKIFPGNDYEKIHQANMVIQENLHRKLTLAELAKVLNVSISTLQKMFYGKMKCSVGKYILSQRLSKAEKLLRSTAMNLGEIAFAIGFESETTLRRALKRETGCSPSQIRKAARGIIVPGIELKSNGFPSRSK
jgi:AraC-like DNA-binding protein/quercetin dioxygenase-like cupin family protein